MDLGISSYISYDSGGGREKAIFATQGSGAILYIVVWMFSWQCAIGGRIITHCNKLIECHPRIIPVIV